MLKTSHEPESIHPNQKYLWQQAVLDAVAETHPEQRMKKINEAQRQISTRLAHLSDLNEQAAIRDALRTLSSLLPEPRQSRNESGGKKEIA